jgi:hypothetical protein
MRSVIVAGIFKLLIIGIIIGAVETVDLHSHTHMVSFLVQTNDTIQDHGRGSSVSTDGWTM